MNIFYGVIILNLEELSQQKQEKEASQEINSKTQLENELEDIRGELERSKTTTTRRIKTMIAAVEVDELSIEQMVVSEPAATESEQSGPPCTKMKNILNICLTFLITINLTLEFEGQSADFAFLTDSVDCGLSLCCFCVLIFTIAIDIR